MNRDNMVWSDAMDELAHSILLVEDHSDSANCLARLLNANGFGNVVIARNGQEAIRAARQRCFDLALCDIGLSDVDGCALCKALLDKVGRSMADNATRRGTFD